MTRGKPEKASPLCDIISDTLKDTFKAIQCMCLLYVSEISVNSNHVLSANVYWEEFVDTSLFSALKRQQKIHDFHLYFAPTLPYYTCPQTLQIQWPEPVLLPLAWSGHFQVQVPLLLHHSQPLPKVLLLFPANERHFFLHSTEKWLSLTWKSIHIFCLLFHVECFIHGHVHNGDALQVH